MFIEVITDNLSDSISTKNLNINRIELVKDLHLGGLTPDIELTSQVCDNVTIPVNIMLRCHAESFTYSENDMQIMLRDLERIKKTKANGIVFGCLDASGNIDTHNLEKILANKEHLKLTFHRAIDEAKDYQKALSVLLSYDIDTILTSGTKTTAIDGLDNINKAQQIVSNKIKILAGAGLKEDNIYSFIDNCKTQYIHLGTGARINNDFSKGFNKKFLDKLTYL